MEITIQNYRKLFVQMDYLSKWSPGCAIFPGIVSINFPIIAIEIYYSIHFLACSHIPARRDFDIDTAERPCYAMMEA